jgi:c-di-GMP-binding flagellar brake protein YcgR
MNGSDDPRERRRSPRRSIELPLEYHVMNAGYSHAGLVVNISEVGLLILSVKNMPIGTRLKIAVLFPKKFELSNFQVTAEIVWKDVHVQESWEGYRYGLEFTEISGGDRRKLRELLSAKKESSAGEGEEEG